MITQTHFNKVNEPIKVNLFFFSINFLELAVVSASFFVVMIIFGVVNMFVSIIGVIPFLVICSLYVPILYLMSYANRHDHPQFIVSWLAYKIFQPRRIQVYNPRLRN